MPTDKILILASKNLGGVMESSARLSLKDAVELRDDGQLRDARRRAIQSLGYSVGICHADYARAVRLSMAVGDE